MLRARATRTEYGQTTIRDDAGRRRRIEGHAARGRKVRCMALVPVPPFWSSCRFRTLHRNAVKVAWPGPGTGKLDQKFTVTPA